MRVGSDTFGDPIFQQGLQNWKNGNKTKIVIYVIAFDPINIFIDWAHQNDLQILSFVEVINVVGEKMTGNGHEIPNS